MTDNSLISAKQPDNFTTESPVRAFTDFQVSGHYAIGKGFRPSLAHLARYLDAMETREGWRLVQVILPEDDAGDPTILFHKVPRLRVLMSDGDGVMRERITAIVRDEMDAYREFADDLKVPDLGAPHDTLLNTKVTSNFGKTHEASAIYTKGAWWFVTNMIGDSFDATEPMRGYPDAWRHPGQEGWNTPAPRRLGKSPALGEPYAPAGDKPIEYRAYGDEDDDDPINPKHYGGTACAEIGERLSANSYQVLKYNWRLGEKDEERIEIGKAIWYLDRELELAREGWRPIVLEEPMDRHMRKLLIGQPEWTQMVAKTLMSWNRYGNEATLMGLRKRLVSHKSMPGDRPRDNAYTTGLAL